MTRDTGDEMCDAVRVAHGAFDQSVPTTASANSAIGKAQIGRFSDCRKTFTSINGTIERMNTAAKIATNVVDQGSETAIRMTKTSAVAAQATGSRQRFTSHATADSLATAVMPCSRARDRQARSC